MTDHCERKFAACLVCEPNFVRRIVAGIVRDEDLGDPLPEGIGKAVEHGGEGGLGVVGDNQHSDPRIPRRIVHRGRPPMVHARMIATGVTTGIQRSLPATHPRTAPGG